MDLDSDAPYFPSSWTFSIFDDNGKILIDELNLDDDRTFMASQKQSFLSHSDDDTLHSQRLKRQKAVKIRRTRRKSEHVRALNRDDDLATAAGDSVHQQASDSLLVNTSLRSCSADDVLCASTKPASTERDDLSGSWRSETSGDLTGESEGNLDSDDAASGGGGGGKWRFLTRKLSSGREVPVEGADLGDGSSTAPTTTTTSKRTERRRRSCFDKFVWKTSLVEIATDAGARAVDVERKSSSIQLESFTLHLVVSGVEKTSFIISATKGLTLGQALTGPLTSCGLTTDQVDVFLALSRTPLPLSSECFLLAGSNLYVRAKDEDKKDAVTLRANSSLNLAGLGTMSKEKKPSNGTVKSKKSNSPSEDGGSICGSDVSPSGTLSRSGPVNTSDIQKYRSNSRGHSKLQTLLSTFGKAQDKQEQLNDLLVGYSLNGLPRMPDLLTLGRPHYDNSAFHLERHWTDIVDDHESLNKRQHDQQEAIWELLTTEVEYIQKLRAIIDVFMCCLFDIQNEQILNEVDVDKVFSNICDVYYATCHFWVNHMSQVLRQARETRDLLDPCLLKAGFLVFDKIFESYTKYCLEQEQCREYIKTNTKENELFRAFISWGETQKDCNRLKLVDLIVKPWQRLTKYKLLLHAIRKPLDKMDSTPDIEEQKSDIAEMMEQVEKFVHHVNMSMRQRHEHKQMSIISDRIESYDAVDIPSDECVKLVTDFCKVDLTCPVPGCGRQEKRILLLEGNLKLKDTYSKVDVYCFLFTDMLLITKPAAKRGDKVKIIKPPMRLDKVVVYSLRDVASFMLLYLNEYNMAQAVYTLHGDSKLWLESVTKAQNDYKEKRNQYLSHNENLPVDVYDDIDDDFVAQSHEVVLSRHDSDSVADSFIPNCPAPVCRSASCTNSIASSVDSAVHSDTLSRPHSATGLSHDPASSRHSSSSSCDHLRVPKPAYGFESSASGESHSRSLASSKSRLGRTEESAFVGDAAIDGGRTRLNQRRALRTERRYHTADTIRELRYSRDSTIHKRLSLNYNTTAGSDPDRARPDTSTVFNSDSLHSIPSSSGVSSTASLYRANDICEEAAADDMRANVSGFSRKHRSKMGPADCGDSDANNSSVIYSNSSPSSNDAGGLAMTDRQYVEALVDEDQQLQRMIAERKRWNEELLMDSGLEASEV